MVNLFHVAVVDVLQHRLCDFGLREPGPLIGLSSESVLEKLKSYAVVQFPNFLDEKKNQNSTHPVK